MTELAAAELESVDPATLELLGTVTRTDPAAIPETVAEARLAQERWRNRRGLVALARRYRSRP